MAVVLMFVCFHFWEYLLDDSVDMAV